MPVDVNVAVPDQQPLTRQRDNALDEVLGRVVGVAHDDDVASLRLVKAIVKLGGDQVVIVVQRWIHGKADYVDCLHGDRDNEVEAEGQHQDLEHFPYQRLHDNGER